MIPVNGKNENIFDEGKNGEKKIISKSGKLQRGRGKKINPLGGLKEDSESENEATHVMNIITI